ncbi:MAG: ATP-grasp domain-containing protein [Planctomycetaceae bacterium]
MVNWPCVVKPRYGAGSTLTQLCWSRAEYVAAVERCQSTSPPTAAIVQPYVPGRAISIAALIPDPLEAGLSCFPVAEQRLLDDGSFGYVGGLIPAFDVPVASIEETVARCAAAIPGLRGYVGFDLLLPSLSPESPILVEINPRLTTSYVAYRRLAVGRLTQYWLDQQRLPPEIWNDGPLSFTADGVVRTSVPPEN